MNLTENRLETKLEIIIDNIIKYISKECEIERALITINRSNNRDFRNLIDKYDLDNKVSIKLECIKNEQNDNTINVSVLYYYDNKYIETDEKTALLDIFKKGINTNINTELLKKERCNMKENELLEIGGQLHRVKLFKNSKGELNERAGRIIPVEDLEALKDSDYQIFTEEKEYVPLINALSPDPTKTILLHEAEYKYNAPHRFKVIEAGTDKVLGKIQFQEGPIKEHGINGVSNEDLLLMVYKRLKSFQDSPFACKENEMALDKVTEALMWLKHRTDSRISRGVEGHNIV